MDQVSRPLLIALVAAVGFAGAWMTVLRPQAAQSGAETPAAAPGAAGLGRAVEGAKGAVAASESSAARTPGAQAPGAASPAVSPPAVPAAKAASRPAAAPSAPSLTTVLLLAGEGADDALARDVVRSVKRPGIRVLIAPIEKLGDYRDLVGSVEIRAAPTILVIGPDRRAQRLDGLPDVAQVEQALAAAR